MVVCVALEGNECMIFGFIVLQCDSSWLAVAWLKICKGVSQIYIYNSTKNISCENVVIQHKNSNAPVLLTPINYVEDDFFCIPV